MEGQGQRGVFLIVLLLFIVFTPDNTPRRPFRLEHDRLDQERQQDFDVLANSTYGDFDGKQRWLNLTGFREDDGYQWGLLSKAQDRSLSQWSNSQRDSGGDLVFYKEITGEVRGKWIRSGLSSLNQPSINLTQLDPRKEYVSSFWQRNITEDEGEMSLTLRDDIDDTDGPREIKADVSLYSESAPGNGWQTFLKGVHFPGGNVILTSTSSKFDALPALPHFATNTQAYDQAKMVMNKTLIQLWEKKIDQEPDFLAIPRCEIVIFLQPKPVVPVGAGTYLRQIENELKSPEGAPIGNPPPLSYSAVLFSPDCGYVLEAETMFGPKIEAFSRLEGRLLFAFIIIVCLQITLLKRQMEKAATPSTRSRISYQGIGIAALGDGLICIAIGGLTMLDEAGFLVVTAAAYLSFVHVALMEAKFIYEIWTVQVGDPARAERDRQRRTNPPPQPPNELPLPATAPRTDGAVPIIVGSDGELAQPGSPQTFGAVYSQFYLTLVTLVFVSIWATSWPRSLRSGYANLLAACYFSHWWPQIYRNAMRNCRKALAWEYVLGYSVLRTVPILYWYLSPRNILSIDSSPTTAYILLGWIWLQVLVLASQQFLGPRFLVKDSWFPLAYDYHPLLQEDDVEAGGLSIGLLASATEAKDNDDKTRKVFDCAICMNEIDVPVLSKKDGARGAAWLELRNYMVTPCRHIFHAECLEGWMNLRLVCPVCRESLPPL